MTVMMIRVKRIGKSIIDDLESVGLTRIDEMSFCYNGEMIIIHQNFGTKSSTDLVVSNIKNSYNIIKKLQENGMYLSSHIAENLASGDFINHNSKKCKM